MPPLTSDTLSLFSNICHGFFTRRGGVSEGVFASLNCGFGSGDAPAAVAANRARVAAHSGMKEPQLVTAYQIHSATAVAVTVPWVHGDAPQADALVTATPGVLLGVLTADCVPVLLADGEGAVVAAAHAGWKGALSGVLESTVSAMEQLGARRGRIRAAIGPCIGQDSYEVGPEFAARLCEASAENRGFFTPPAPEGKSRFDLMGYVRARLQESDIGAIEAIARDTCAEEESFFSYRRSTLRKENAYGRQISVIGLKE